VVRVLGGRVEIESEPGVGTVARMKLPEAAR
jgi:chemotaxis protein histidine kinase CheA